MLTFTEYLTEACNCWKGYKRVPGTKPCAEDSCVKEEDVSEGAPIVVALPPIDVRNPKKAAQPQRYMGDIVPPTKPPSTEKRGVKGRLGQRPMPTYEQFHLDEAATADGKGHKSATGGLTQKGRDAYNREHGSNLKAPVTTPPSDLKAGSKAANRRKSFCARMSGVDGPMKKPNGEPTRKALALRKWNC